MGLLFVRLLVGGREAADNQGMASVRGLGLQISLTI